MSEPRVLGIEIGGTKLQLGLGDARGTLLALERRGVVRSGGAAGIREQIAEVYASLLSKTGSEASSILAAGIGFGGPVDSSRGRTQRSFQIDGWDDFALTAWVKERLHIPTVILENDSDSAGLAEATRGAGAGFSPVLYMNIGSGIGGALVIDGRIYRGFGQGATEIGHLKVPDSMTPGRGFVELELAASGWAIASAARTFLNDDRARADSTWLVAKTANGIAESITTELVAKAAELGDPRSLAILERAQIAVAFALAQAIVLLAPRRIVIGGGVSLIGEMLWFEPLRRHVDQQVFEPFRRGFDIVAAGLGEEVVVHGALAVASNALASSIGTVLEHQERVS